MCLKNKGISKVFKKKMTFLDRMFLKSTNWYVRLENMIINYHYIENESWE